MKQHILSLKQIRAASMTVLSPKCRIVRMTFTPSSEKLASKNC